MTLLHPTVVRLGTKSIFGRWRGVLSKGFGPDGRRRRYKVSGRTKQDVVEALKKKSEELDAGLSTSRSYTVEAAARDWLEYGLPGRSERTRAPAPGVVRANTV